MIISVLIYLQIYAFLIGKARFCVTNAIDMSSELIVITKYGVGCKCNIHIFIVFSESLPFTLRIIS